jgi:hypothetical protein
VFFYLDHAEDGKETTSTDAPENNPQYTTVYVGNLASEVKKPSSLYQFVVLFTYVCTNTQQKNINFVLPWL